MSQEKKGFICLGYDGEANFIWSEFRQSLFKLTTKELNPNYLNNVLGPVFVKYEYEEEQEQKNGETKIVINYGRLKSDIIIGCQAKGVYDGTNQFGAGVWLNKDGHLVVNSRDIFSTDITFDKSRIQKDAIYVYKKDLGISEFHKMISPADLNLLRAMFDSFNWKKEDSKKLYKGFIATGLISGALMWRAHMYLFGEAGSGKSTLQIASSAIWGPNAILAEGDSSEAGIRQKVGRNSGVVQLDESEPDGDKLMRILGMFRSASSGGTVLRGTSDQIGTDYILRFQGILSGIIQLEMRQADVSRFINVELAPLTPEMRKGVNPEVKLLLNDKERLRELGAQLQMYFINNFHKLDLIQKEIRKLFILGDNTDRYADTYSHVIAAAFMIDFHDKDYTNDDIKKYFDTFDFSEQLEQQKHKDHEELLEKILNKDILDENSKHKTQIINHIYRAYHYYLNDKKKEFISTNSALGIYGIRTLDNKDNLEILIDPSRDQLKDLLKGTRFSGGNLSGVLSRLDSAVTVKEAKMIGGSQRRNTLKITLNADKYNFAKYQSLLGADFATITPEFTEKKEVVKPEPVAQKEPEVANIKPITIEQAESQGLSLVTMLEDFKGIEAGTQIALKSESKREETEIVIVKEEVKKKTQFGLKRENKNEKTSGL